MATEQPQTQSQAVLHFNGIYTTMTEDHLPDLIGKLERLKADTEVGDLYQIVHVGDVPKREFVGVYSPGCRPENWPAPSPEEYGEEAGKAIRAFEERGKKGEVDLSDF